MQPTGSITKQAAKSISAALHFLSTSQLPSGQFKTYVSPDEMLQTNSKIVPGEVFTTALVLTNLALVDDNRAAAIVQRAVPFLLAERQSLDVCSYWTRSNNGAASLKLGLNNVWNPPDVEDTALVSIVLERIGISCRRNHGVLLGNRRSDGVFHTWIVPRKRLPLNVAHLRVVLPQLGRLEELKVYWEYSGACRDDVDGGINANVLLYLGSRRETRAAAGYLVDVVKRGAESACDKWYRHPLAVQYFISRAFANGVVELGDAREEIVGRVEAADLVSSPLHAALGISTLLDFNAPSRLVNRAVEYLLETQNADGSWARAALYGRAGSYSFGSEELTTGLGVSALTHYERLAPIT